jgi:hypothetical protein
VTDSRGDDWNGDESVCRVDFFGDPVAEAFQLGELRLCAVGEISVRGRGVPPAILDEGDL